MKNELFSIGPFTVYGYGLMIAIGIIAAYLAGEYRAKKYGLEADHVFNYVIWCVVGGFSGSKLLYLRGNYRRHFVRYALFQNKRIKVPRLF